MLKQKVSLVSGLEMLVSLYAIFVLVFSFFLTDLNPIWYWDWYAKTIGGWLQQNPRFFGANLIFASVWAFWICLKYEDPRSHT